VTDSWSNRHESAMPSCGCPGIARFTSGWGRFAIHHEARTIRACAPCPCGTGVTRVDTGRRGHVAPYRDRRQNRLQQQRPPTGRALHGESWYWKVAADKATRLFLGRSTELPRTTYGNVYISSGAPSSDRLAHEEKHADQWAVMGLSFGLTYLGVSGFTAAIKYFTGYRGDKECLNPFEFLAGLKGGGYTC